MQDMVPIELLLSLLIIFIIGLIVETILHNRNINSIPLRISVSGTRGKTSVVRILASILRESGRVVLAKTTGTEAKYILPDGTEEDLKRIGSPNILEQKKMLRKAVELRVDCLITEIMSIQPENHWLESHKLIKPHYTILTNLRPDHINTAEGESMYELYQNDIFPGSVLFMEKSDVTEDLRKKIHRKGVKLNTFKSIPLSVQNQDIAGAVALQLGIATNHIHNGIKNCKMDKGEARGYEFRGKAGPVIFVNSFAANDPVSSRLLMDETVRQLKLSNPDIIGLFSFRMDRGERSQQWLQYLKKEGKDRFDQIFYLGTHGQVYKRILHTGESVRIRKPELITSEIIESCNGPSIVFGLVNIGGVGMKLVNYWEESARKIELLK